MQKTPDDIFIYHGRETLSYRSVFESALRLANHFHQQGIGKDTRVVVMLRNSPEIVYTWLALSRLEAVMIPVNVHYKSLALRYIIDDSSATAIVYHAEHEKDVVSATSILESCELFICLGDDCQYEKSISFEKYRDKPIFGGPYNPDNNDTNVIFYSGASTGPAKYAKYSNSQLHRNTNDYLHAIIYKPGDVIFSQCPLTHFLGYVVVLNAVVNAGASLAFCDSDNKEECLQALENAAPRYLVAEPAYFRELIQKDKDYLPSSVKCAITGGGRLKKDVHEAFTKRFGIPVFKIYGMVEAGPILSVNTDADKPSSIGTALSKISLGLLKDGKMLADNEVGEICVVSGILTEDLQKLLKDDISGGWYHTGDLGYLDMDGHLYFIDRKAYVINVRGFDVYPEQVESVLSKHPRVRDVVVVGKPKDEYSESIYAYIIPETGKRPEDKELYAFLENELPRYQIPDAFIYVNHFPRSATGKVVRQALK
ncbi:MAG: class I adenylate-forming enzyme family protein [Candidatus Marinimicrobia bacterium]|nr:class I adenylate-forming enzyme family protein [Candidatus Neomarinimicrobiota bacterium]